jgi:hypothetical protein
MGDWKAIRSKQGAPLELYDLVKDLSEERNIADRHPEVVRRIETYLQTARTDSPHWPKKPEKKKQRSSINSSEPDRGCTTRFVDA